LKMSGIMIFLFWWDFQGLPQCHKNYITAIMNPMDSTGKGSSHCAPRPKHPPSPLLQETVLLINICLPFMSHIKAIYSEITEYNLVANITTKLATE